MVKTKNDIHLKIEFCNLGEGYDGDYNHDDPDDVNLLRFDVSIKKEGDMEWSEVPNASYCTQMPAHSSFDILEKALVMMMDEIFDAAIEGHSIKKACERMSWISPDMVTKGVWTK
jgi:hypothetical protein